MSSSLFLLLSLFLKMYDTEPLEFSFDYILAKLITGSLTFDPFLWNFLQKDNILTDMKNYDILKPILSMHDVKCIVNDKIYGKILDKYLVKIQNSFYKIESYYKKILSYHVNNTQIIEEVNLLSKKIVEMENPNTPIRIMNETINLFYKSLTILSFIKDKTNVSLYLLKK